MKIFDPGAMRDNDAAGGTTEGNATGVGEAAEVDVEEAGVGL
jgi:hypothetical protein